MKRVRGFQIELEFGSVGFQRRKENRSNRRKTSRSKEENQQQTQPTYGVDARIWARATLVGGECFHYCPTLAPLQLTTPKNTITYQNALCSSSQNFSKALSSVSLGSENGPKRNWKQCLCKICGDKQRELWYVMVFSGVVNSVVLILTRTGLHMERFLSG